MISEQSPYTLQHKFMDWEDSGYTLGQSMGTDDLSLFYAITSIAYYSFDKSLISDGVYDLLCKELMGREDTPEWIEKESLEAGTGYDISNFPRAAMYVAHLELERAGHE